MEKIMNDNSKLDHRELSDTELDEVSSGGSIGYKDGRLHLGGTGAVPSHRGVIYIDDALVGYGYPG